MRLWPWRKQGGSAGIDDLRRDGEARLAEARELQERLRPKMRYQAERHRRNSVVEEAVYVLSGGRRR